ncbi:MAG: ChaN family lipoprotein [Vicingaceae bacterium]|nr:ChaN family lipoprotein [Vicingaceae bacterium]
MPLKKISLLFTLAVFLFAFKGDKKAYQIFNQNGKKASYDKILKEVETADIILFGELHDNPICHWMQLELTKDIFNTINEDLVLGAEMFEADNQITINEYLGGHHSYNTFKKEVKVWPNNKTDYQPLVDFSLSNQLPFIATNIPRRYANIVYKKGFKGLNNMHNHAKRWIAPLPIKYDKNLPGYQKIIEMAGGHGGENLPKAQAIKDATMAHFILKNYRKGSTFIHYNGTYHSDNFEGIAWYLKQGNPNLKIVTIASVEQEKIDSLKDENLGIASFVLCTPESMTKTY